MNITLVTMGRCSWKAFLFLSVAIQATQGPTDAAEEEGGRVITSPAVEVRGTEYDLRAIENELILHVESAGVASEIPVPMEHLEITGEIRAINLVPWRSNALFAIIRERTTTAFIYHGAAFAYSEDDGRVSEVPRTYAILFSSKEELANLAAQMRGSAVYALFGKRSVEDGRLIVTQGCVFTHANAYPPIGGSVTWFDKPRVEIVRVAGFDDIVFPDSVGDQK